MSVQRKVTIIWLQLFTRIHHFSPLKGTEKYTKCKTLDDKVCFIDGLK